MLVRRYVVKDMPEAVVMIRKDLGKGAVILSSKRIRVKKWFGLWHTKRIEVLAATGDDVPVRTVDPIGQVRTEEVAVLRQPAASSSDALRAAVEAPTAQPQAALDELARMRQEMADIRVLLQKGSPNVLAPLIHANDDSPVLTRLMEHGIRKSVALDLVAQDLSANDALGQIVASLKPALNAEPIRQTSRVCLFVGPTGVGKTTTVAKIAALHVLSGDRRVGLITTDTFRIAAVEQLKTYAKILRVPLEVVTSPADLPNALERLADCDLILIDTAGRSYRSGDQLTDIAHLQSVAAIDETYLVLSMTSKPEDLESLAEIFTELPFDKFLFTKIDETNTVGPILTLLHLHRKPLSYVTTGQNVPDDIEIASLDKIVRFIIEGGNLIA